MYIYHFRDRSKEMYWQEETDEMNAEKETHRGDTEKKEWGLNVENISVEKLEILTSKINNVKINCEY